MGPSLPLERQSVSERVLTLKDMTQGSGCTPRTVRYYERQGLLRALRSSGGHRQFAQSELERLNFIISLREAGWSLEDVTEFLALRSAAQTDGQAVAGFRATVDTQVERLDRKIAILQRLRDELAQTALVVRVCTECTSLQARVECNACARVPALGDLPRPFRLIWRARELDGASFYDEQQADGDDVSPADDSGE